MKSRDFFHPGLPRLAACALLVFALPRGSGWADMADILRAQGFHEAPISRNLNKNEDFIEIQINGHPFKLLIDTGAQVTSIRRAAAERANLNEGAAAGVVHGVNGLGVGQAHIAQVTSFTIGGVPLAPSPVVIADLGDYRLGHGRFDGLLGLATMRLNHAIFGYNPEAFFFNPKGSATEQLNSYLLTHGYARVRLALEDGAYYLPISFNNVPARMMLDSGASATLLSVAFGEKANFSALRDFYVQNSGVDPGKSNSALVMPDRISIGPLALPAITVTAGDSAFVTKPARKGGRVPDGLAGFDLIGSLSPFLDAGHDWLYIAGQRPSDGLP